MKKVLLTAVACLMFAVPAMADLNCATGTYNFNGVCAKPTPEQGLELLMKGNAKFVKGDLELLKKYSSPTERTEVAAGQKPFAIVLTCADSRLPAEIIFDKGLGEIFVVRVAGNIVERHELGSIEYALEHLGANLIVVLGHERCGAVTAAYNANGVSDGSNIGSLIESIAPAIDKTKTVEECIISNIHNVAKELEERSTIIKELVEKGETMIVRAKYDLDSGKVELLAE